MGFSTWMAFRYLNAKKDKFLSVINLVSVAGIAIGVAALIIVIGVMSGFDHDLREKIIGANAHILVERETGLKKYKQLNEELKTVKGVKFSTPYIHGNVFLETGTRAMSLILRGVVPETEGSVTKIDGYLKDFKIANLKEDEVVIGAQLAEYYGYKVGDTVTIIAPASGVAGNNWRFTFKVAGIFTSGMYDYDMNLVIVSLAKAQEVNKEVAKYVDVMIGNEEDFTACLGFEIEGNDENLKTLNLDGYKKMINEAAATYPNFKAVATTLRQVKTATVNDWSAICWADGEIYKAAQYDGLEIMDRVGGGDSFASGLVYGLMTFEDAEKAVNYGAAHGALAMTTPGDTTMASLKEVEGIVGGAGARVQR